MHNNCHGKLLIAVPESVQGLNISKLEANSSHVALSLQWMVSEQCMYNNNCMHVYTCTVKMINIMTR